MRCTRILYEVIEFVESRISTLTKATVIGWLLVRHLASSNCMLSGTKKLGKQVLELTVGRRPWD